MVHGFSKRTITVGRTMCHVAHCWMDAWGHTHGSTMNDDDEGDKARRERGVRGDDGVVSDGCARCARGGVRVLANGTCAGMIGWGDDGDDWIARSWLRCVTRRRRRRGRRRLR